MFRSPGSVCLIVQAACITYVNSVLHSNSVVSGGTDILVMKTEKLLDLDKFFSAT